MQNPTVLLNQEITALPFTVWLAYSMWLDAFGVYDKFKFHPGQESLLLCGRFFHILVTPVERSVSVHLMYDEWMFQAMWVCAWDTAASGKCGAAAAWPVMEDAGGVSGKRPLRQEIKLH